MNFRFKGLPLILFPFLLLPRAVLAQANGTRVVVADSLKLAPGSGTAENVPDALRMVENNAFTVGEKLEYIIRYGSILAGRSRLSVPEIVDFNGYPCYRIVSEAWSNKFFSRFYKVRDHVESLTDTRGIFSWRFEKHLREGKYKKDLLAIHDQVNHLAYIDGDTLKIPPFLHDVLSAMYYLRTLDLAPGDTVYLDNQDNAKIYPLKIVIHRRETIKVKAGKFRCLVAEPFIRTPALFRQNGRIVVFLSDDRNKIPVMMKTYIFVKGFSLGTVTTELEKMEGVLRE